MSELSTLLHWETLTLRVSLHDADDSRILKIEPPPGLGPTEVSPHALEDSDPANTRLRTAASTLLDLDAHAARSARRGTSLVLRVRPPRQRTARVITSVDQAMVQRPRIDELLSPIIFGSLPHPPMREFQNLGIEWLAARDAAILADDMGLGKTAQALLAMQLLITNGHMRSALVVCPKSLIANWESECSKWTPALTVVRANPQRLEASAVWSALLGRTHILLASYEQLRPLPSAFHSTSLDLAIADEAHRLRRSQTQIVRSFRQIRRSRFWALTGTPIERHPEDLGTLLSILRPTGFTTQSATDASELRALARPYILRRLKQDVLSELPEVIETKEAIELSSNQRRSYSAVQTSPLNSNAKDVLHRLQLLRSLCDVDSISESSSKIDRIVQILDTINESGEKAIVFSFLLRPLDLLMQRLSQHDPPLISLSLTGDMASDDRTDAIREFKTNERIVALLCSSRVGGEGLTLVEANHVIFLNEWWNPSANAQARDRVVRLGQERIVHVHRFRCKGTVEELLDSILESKERSFDSIVNALATEVRLEGIGSHKLLDEALRRVDADD